MTSISKYEADFADNVIRAEGVKNMDDEEKMSSVCIERKDSK